MSPTDRGDDEEDPPPTGVRDAIAAIRHKVPGPEREGKPFSDRAASRVGKQLVRRAIQWYVEPYQERADEFDFDLIAILEHMSVADDRAWRDLRRLEREVAALAEATERRLADQDRVPRRLEARVARLENELSALASGAAAIGPVEPGPTATDRALGLVDYLGFEDRHRGSAEQVTAALARYVDRFRDAAGPVVDVGCGRGEFLALLRDAAIPAYGVDIEGSMLSVAVEQGLDAREEDAVAHLQSLDPGSIGGVFSSQVAEHLTPAHLTALCRASARALVPGGVFVAETPNPESLMIFASFFYVDLSHTNPIHPEAFTFLLENAGFVDVEIVRIDPVPDPMRLEVPEPPSGLDPALAGFVEAQQRNLQRLNDLLYGPQQYAVVATAPSARPSGPSGAQKPRSRKRKSENQT